MAATADANVARTAAVSDLLAATYAVDGSSTATYGLYTKSSHTSVTLGGGPVARKVTVLSDSNHTLQSTWPLMGDTAAAFNSSL